MESVLIVECEIPSLKLAVDILQDTSTLEENFFHLDQLDEQCQDTLVALDINKCHTKF